MNAPGCLKITLAGNTFNLMHPDGKLTCFPAQSARVKVTRAAADGWGKRELRELILYPDRSIAARFSDGSESHVATAAPARAAAILAA